MNPSQVIIAPIFPLWVILILLVLGSIFTFFQFRLIRKRLSLKRSLSLFLLRLAALSLLILFALNPTWTVRKETKVSPTLAILLDNSPGMGMPGREGKGSRLDEARALLLDGREASPEILGEKFDVRLYEFGESLKALNPEDLATLKVGEKKGDLGASLRPTVREDFPGPPGKRRKPEMGGGPFGGLSHLHPSRRRARRVQGYIDQGRQSPGHGFSGQRGGRSMSR